MFRLQRLEITGFKSFAEFTEIIFTEDGGITAVVGPNGCGKSNVADAISWVLGEQSARSLRGAEMQDVIFQGTRNRQPSGMSEVVLHLVRDDDAAIEFAETDEFDEALSDFDERSQDFEDFKSHENPVHSNGNGFHAETNGSQNGNGFHSESAVAAVGVAEAPVAKAHVKKRWRTRRAALDFAPGEAVSITRRLYRSGESEYLLNNRACRLRDINDLFAGTGLAGASYALVQQERISQILSAKPSDRRALVEEAAGISRFRTRQRAAEIRLESAKTNLRRLSDIVTEIERQANSLRRQAGRTRRFKEMQETLRASLRQVFIAEGGQLTDQLTELRAQFDEATVREKDLTQAAATKADAAQRATRTAREREEKLAEIRALAAEAALGRERAARDLTHQTEQLAIHENRRNILNGEIKASAERLRATAADAARLREKNQQAVGSNQTEAADLQAAENDFQRKRREVSDLETEIEKLRSQLLRHTAAAERLREIARQQANALERLAERDEGLAREGVRAEATHAEKRAEAAALQKKIAAARARFDDAKNKEKAVAHTLSAARDSLRAAESDRQKTRDEANGIRHRRETLEKLDASNALLAPDVQKLFAAREKLNLNLCGTLADFVGVEARFEQAVEAVFGSLLQTILVETRADADKIAAWLRENNAGQISVLVCKPSAEKSKTAKSSEKIRDLLNAPANLSDILNCIFPQKMSFRVVETAADALENENYVTLDGEQIRQSQFFVVGKSNQKNANGILSFKRELRELAARAVKLENELSKSTETVETAQNNLKEKEDAAKNLQTVLQSEERALFTIESELKAVEQERERAERHARVVADESRRIADERRDLESKREKAESDSQIAETERQTAENKINEISLILLDAKQKAETAAAALSKKRAAAAAEAERRRSLASALRRVEADERELSVSLEKGRAEFSETSIKIEALRRSLADLNKQNAAVEAEKHSETAKISAAAEQLRAARELADESAAELNELNARLTEAKDARAALEVQRAALSTRFANLRENCSRELGQSLEDLTSDALFEDFDLTAERRRVESLREKLDNFGAVNLLALEELSEAETRLLFLNGQKKDIVDSIESAEEALAEIKRRSRERFELAFDEINRNFSEFFSSLFGGGRGEMNLLDATDVLESGIEIVAQPPGKRLQNLLLLSGGEKAMTAIALVLAIFRFRPSPFCLLDEVDAPLDEANVGRFVEKIAEMSEKTQFIVITHNKRTMEAARALYGVTMEEAGVSKVVSVKFE
jgi:chromosome segregation protein